MQIKSALLVTDYYQACHMQHCTLLG